MSLHHLAQNMQSKGRNGDSVLVHMTPGEVHGLQALAMAHGGSLTLNPETGLPEANFLKSLLPTLLGVGLSFIPGVGPLMAAGIVGAGTGLATGSLEKGLMAGLGAYGGASLGAGLMAAGTPAITPAAANAATANALNASTTAGANVFNTGVSGATNAAMPLANTAGAVTTGAQIPGIPGTNVANMYAPNIVPPAAPVAAVNAVPNIAGTNVNAMASQYAQQAQALPAGSIQSTPMPSNFERAQAGFKDVTSSGDKAWEFAKKYPGALASTGLSIAQGLQKKYQPPAKEKSLIRPYDYTYGKTEADVTPYSGSGERTYFNPVFTAKTPYEAPGPEYAADGGLMALKYAVGGPVEQMSAENAIGANQMYPQSQLQTAMYSNPMVQRPQAGNVINPSGDAGVDPYTGEARFAKGGATPETTGEYKYDYNPQTQQFTQTAKPTPVNPISRMFGGLGNAGMTGAPLGNGPIAQVVRAAQGQAAPATSAAPIVSGGVAPPMFQPQAQQSFQPQTVIPEYQSPEQQLGLGGFYDYMNQQMGGMQQQGYAMGGNVAGNQAEGHLGGYSDGGRLLKGPGDGVSDSIPAVIGNRQPARLADGEFVVPARIVSELGNGSTEAGARKLYAMMERVQKGRKQSIGKNKVAVNSKSDKYLPA